MNFREAMECLERGGCVVNMGERPIHRDIIFIVDVVTISCCPGQRNGPRSDTNNERCIGAIKPYLKTKDGKPIVFRHSFHLGGLNSKKWVKAKPPKGPYFFAHGASVGLHSMIDNDYKQVMLEKLLAEEKENER